MVKLVKWTGLILFAGIVGLASAVLLVAGTWAQTPVAVVQGAMAQAKPPAPYNYGWGMGPGMMGGFGYSMMGGYGRWSYSNDVVPQRTPVPVDQEIHLEAVNFRFDPATITVKAGETVRLVIANKDGVPHNLYSADVALGYSLLPAGQVQSVTFTAPATPGTYLAACTFHPGMTLEIVVQ
jgi:plastocyanin